MEWFSWALVVFGTFVLMVLVSKSLSGTLWGEGKNAVPKTEYPCSVGVTAGCLCETCKERYIAARLKQVELEIQERDRKNFLEEVDKSIEEMRKKHGLDKVKPTPQPAHHPYNYSIHDPYGAKRRFLRQLQEQSGRW